VPHRDAPEIGCAHEVCQGLSIGIRPPLRAASTASELAHFAGNPTGMAEALYDVIAAVSAGAQVDSYVLIREGVERDHVRQRGVRPARRSQDLGR
jgi:hypothetical protein